MNNDHNDITIVQETKKSKLFKKISYFVKIAHQLTWEELKATDVFPGQPVLLLSIANLNPINQTDLAKHLKIKPATLTLRLQKLENRGFIERVSDENDKRMQYVTITNQGQKVLNEGMKILGQIGEDIFECLNKEDLDYLEKMFNRLIEHVKEKRKGKKEAI